MGLEQPRVGFDDALGQRVGITRSGMIEGLRELLICRPGPFCKGPGIIEISLGNKIYFVQRVL